MTSADELYRKIQKVIMDAPNRDQSNMRYLMILMMMETLHPSAKNKIEIYRNDRRPNNGKDVFTIIVPAEYGKVRND